jgi:hypothetical protein
VSSELGLHFRVFVFVSHLSIVSSGGVLFNIDPGLVGPGTPLINCGPNWFSICRRSYWKWSHMKWKTDLCDLSDFINSLRLIGAPQTVFRIK